MKEYTKGYYVTPTGEVWSDRRGKMKQLSPGKNKHGYLQVILCDNKKRTGKYVHQLVGECYIPNPHNYTEINHKDGDKLNNNVSNLEWCSRKHNCEHKFCKSFKVEWKSTGEIFEIYNRNQFCRDMKIYPNQLSRRGKSVIHFRIID